MTLEPFRAPKTGDPRDNELAFERLNVNLTTTADTLTDLALSVTTISDSLTSLTVDVTTNAAAITANAAAITANLASTTAAIEAASALKVDIDEALTDVTLSHGSAPTVYSYGAPSGFVAQTEWNSSVRPTINTAFSQVHDNIQDLQAKLDEITAIIRND